MMKTRGAGNCIRRSKRQAGLGVSPVEEKKNIKRQKKKDVAPVNVELDCEVQEPVRGGKGEEGIAGVEDKQSGVGAVLDDIPEEVDQQAMSAEAQEDEAGMGGAEKQADEAARSEGEEDDDDVDMGESEKEADEEVHVDGEKDTHAGVEDTAAGVDVQADPNDKEGEEPSEPAGVTDNASTSTTKRTRGETKMRRVSKDPLGKVEIEFSALGEHTGSGSVTLSSFLGPLVREHVPVLVDDWRHVDAQIKHTMWEEIQGRFKLEEEWMKTAIFQQMGRLWRSSKAVLLDKVRAAKSHADRVKLKPSNIDSVAAWNSWVKSRLSSEFKEKSKRYSKMRKGQIPQTSSRKGFYRLGEEMKKKSSNPAKVTRSKIWLAGHTHKDGRPVKPEFAKTIEEIQSIDSQMESTANDDISQDAVSQVLGKDKPGRVRGMGSGITMTKLAFLQARDKHVMKLQESQAELINEIKNLNRRVEDLAGKKKHDTGVGHSQGRRCQLLKWLSEEDVVVGEGEFCSSDPGYKIGRVPLGKSAVAVIVKSVIDREAPLYRPISTLTTLGEAEGQKIAWAVDKVIFDEGTSTTPYETSASQGTRSEEAPIQRCKVYDWEGGHGEVVAEGVVCSTNPTDMVDNDALGIGCAIVRITLIRKEAVYLFRPTSDLLLLADALNAEIAWPLNKIELINPNAEKAPVSAPKTNSGTSKGKQKKCNLLDCTNSNIVAEGHVCPSDPADLVHFKALGPNASKVWVDVSFNDAARVWRPNSEVKFMGDAIGTIVAWPNDKIEYV